VCSSDEAGHESVVPDTLQSHTTVTPERCRLPDDIETGLHDADCDIPLDVSHVANEEFVHICSKVAEQRNSYRIKCIQVSKLR